MARANPNRRAWLWAALLAGVAPAYFTVSVALSDTIGLRGSRPLVDVLLDVLYLLALISAAASGFVGGLVRGVVATSMVWLLIAVALYVALDPACPLPMGQLPDHVAAIATIDGSAAIECYAGGTPTRGNNIGFVVLGGIAATLLAAVGGLVRAADLQWWPDGN